jgi:hypothetical protein
VKRYLPLAAAFALVVIWLDPLGLAAKDANLDVGHVKAVAGDTWASVAHRLAPGASNTQINTFAVRIRDANGQTPITAGRILVYDLADVPEETTPVPTTPPPSTTAAPTSRGPRPGAVLFAEDFAGDTMADFTSRFDWSVADLGRRNGSWHGHHDMACGPPDAERVLRHGPAYKDTDPGVEFWLCGPKGPASDHLMTSNGDNYVFGVTAFSPKQTFTNAHRVCWDVNLTESFGRRLWWEVQLLPAAAVANAKSLVDMGVSIRNLDSERGTAYLAWGVGLSGTLTSRPIPPDAVVFDFTEELVRIWKGQQLAFDPGNSWEPGVRYVTQDRATRARHCWTDNSDGTSTFSQQRPGQADYVQTVPVSFPPSFRVIFSAHNYNAGKEGTASNATWHWDNLLVEGSR